MTPRKHADLIKLWADGAIIQFLRGSYGWEDCHGNYPAWDEGCEYRVKPKPIKDIAITRTVELSHAPKSELLDGMVAVGCFGRDNVKFIFDGHTHLLKSVELL